jgi:nucleoside-diphosphate-sugar epimerase
MYHMMLTRGGELDAVVLRLTNVYGPRMALRIPCQGVLNVFLRRLLTGQRVTVYGDGAQLRDPLYIDDAVEAFLAAGAIASLPARTYNIGGPEPLSLLKIASIASEAADCDSPQIRPFPAEQRAIDIGDYVANVTQISRDLHWTPSVTFQDGIQRTIAYYRSEQPHYLNPDCPEPVCNLPEHDGTPRRLTYLPI